MSYKSEQDYIQIKDSILMFTWTKKNKPIYLELRKGNFTVTLQVEFYSFVNQK